MRRQRSVNQFEQAAPKSHREFCSPVLYDGLGCPRPTPVPERRASRRRDAFESLCFALKNIKRATQKVIYIPT